MKKSVLVLTILLLLSLVATTTAAAKGGPDKQPTWEQAFDPIPPMGEGANTWHGVEFKGNLYFVFWGTDNVDHVWGSPDGKSWSLAWKATDIQEGFEGIGTMFVFKNQLYLYLLDWEGELPAQVMRTPDGQHWEAVASNEATETYFTDFTESTSFQGALYLVNIYVGETSFASRLWRSTSGDPGTWEEVVVFPDWDGVASFASFKGALYAQSNGVNIYNPSTLEWEMLPTQILRSYDGVSWEPVNTDGFGEPMNFMGGGLAAHKGYLYAGTGSLDVSGGDIWRSRDGLSWEPVTTDGFGRPANLVMLGFATYKGMLFSYSAGWEGIEVYASKDGLHWNLTNEAGWGLGINRDHAQVVFKGSLYLGVIGPAGVMKLAKP